MLLNNKIGDVGEKKYNSEKRQEIAEFEKNAVLIENERDRDTAESKNNLEISKVEFNKMKLIAEQEANAVTEKRKYELQKEIELTRKVQEAERIRANTFTVADVEAEIKKRTAEGIADAVLVEAEAYSKSIKIRADADAFALKVKGEADANVLRTIAEANYYKMETEANAVKMMVSSIGTPEAYQTYLMINQDVLPRIAKENANAIKDMKPSITVWQTGDNNGQKNPGLSAVVNDLIKTNLPMFEGLSKTTGVDLLQSFRNKGNTTPNAELELQNLSKKQNVTPNADFSENAKPSFPKIK